MPTVSLILLESESAPSSPDRVESIRKALGDAGHEVQVLRVAGPTDGAGPAISTDSDETDLDDPVLARGRGLSVAAVAGLLAARGESLVVLDAGMEYTAEDVCHLVARLLAGDAELVVASRNAEDGVDDRGGLIRRLAARAGRLARPWLGTSDPFGGLIALDAELARRTVRTFRPVGSKFTLELIVRSKCSKAEIPVAHVVGSKRTTPILDEVRQFKRLADDTFGNISRLVQFCFVGFSGMMVDLSCYALFQWILKRTGLVNSTVSFLGYHTTLDLVAAAAGAIGLALTWNFYLNRRLTFNDARHGSILRQYLAYALSNALGIALSFSLRLFLPMKFAFFADHKLAGAVVGIVTATGLNFTMSRWLVFKNHGQSKSESPSNATLASEPSV